MRFREDGLSAPLWKPVLLYLPMSVVKAPVGNGGKPEGGSRMQVKTGIKAGGGYYIESRPSAASNKDAS
jgi:hypothetical protein